MIPYADTNLLTRFYLKQPDTEEAVSLLESFADGETRRLPIIWLHRVELINAFQLHLFLARAPGQSFVTPEQVALAHANFRSDVQTGGIFRQVVISPPELEQQFEELSLRHTARHGFRTYDLLHVASALILKCDLFLTFDRKTSELAALEGMKIRS